MKAVVYEEIGPPEVLEIREVEKPIPADNELLIKVIATSVTTGDLNARGLTRVPPGLGPMARMMMGRGKPKHPIIGADIAGEIEAVGKDVRSFKAGDQVYGINGERLGGYAEYVCWPEHAALVEKPSNMSFEEAAAVPFGASTSLYFLREKGHIRSGQKVLINGASGGVGSSAVQLAKALGAQVTGVCSTRNMELVRSLGADEVIDYTQEDFAQRDDRYDLILDTVLGETSFSRVKDSLKANGCYLAVAGGLKEMIQMRWTSLVGKKKVIFGGGLETETKKNLDFARELIEAGKYKAVIDRTYPLEEIVDAHRYVEAGRKRGNVVITVAPA